jgi:hypothetical protein
LLPLLALIAFATPAAAQQQPSRLPPSEAAAARDQAPSRATIVAAPVAVMIAAFDADGDAAVSRAELEAGVRRSFEASTRAEAMGYIEFGDWAKRWLGDSNALPSPFETDRNGDNRITEAELQLRFGLFFAEYDKDKDGAITRAELLTVRTPPGFGLDGRGRMRMRRQPQ